MTISIIIDIVAAMHAGAEASRGFRHTEGSLSLREDFPISDWLKALADECRIQIILLLWRKGETCVTDIVSAFAIGQPTISHHLRILRQAGIVRCRKEGLWCHYRLDPTSMRAMSRWFRLLSQKPEKEARNGI